MATNIPPVMPLAQSVRGLKYNPRSLETLKNKYEFVHVSATTNTSKRHLTGAPKIWAKPESQDEVYNIQLRISGKPENIQAALLGAGYNANDIANSMAAYGITRLNYQTTMADAFNAETLGYKTFASGEKVRKGGMAKPTRAQLLGNILWWADNLDKAELVSKAVGTVVSGPSGKGSRNVLLTTKFQEAVGKGKFLNLNKWDPASIPYATGARVVDPPTAKSRQFHIKGLPFLVDPKDISKMVAAVNHLQLADNALYANGVRALSTIIQTTQQSGVPAPVRPASTLILNPSQLPTTTTGLPLFRQ